MVESLTLLMHDTLCCSGEPWYALRSVLSGEWISTPAGSKLYVLLNGANCADCDTHWCASGPRRLHFCASMMSISGEPRPRYRFWSSSHGPGWSSPLHVHADSR